jgi:hypothetical protein
MACIRAKGSIIFPSAACLLASSWILPRVLVAFVSRSLRNKCELFAHSSRVLWWNNHLSPAHLRVFHFVLVTFVSHSLRNKCELLAHSSRVLWWNNHISPEHLDVFHFVWHLPFDLFGLRDPTSSYATAVIALRVIGARKPHHHDKDHTSWIQYVVVSITRIMWDPLRICKCLSFWS